MKPSRQEILQAAFKGDVALLRELAHRGADFNQSDPGEWTLLEEAVLNLCVDVEPFRYVVVRALLELGADPNMHDDEGGSPLTTPTIRMDTEMLQILLEAGADPNKIGGFWEDESFYDWAERDYGFDALPRELPEEPTEDDMKDAESWLSFCDRLAIKHNYRRPDHLFLLRRYGAKSMAEIKGIEKGDDADG